MSIYEVPNEFSEEVEQAEKQKTSIVNKDMTVVEAEEKLINLCKVVANLTAESKSLKELKTDIDKKIKTVNNSTEYLTREIEKLVYFLYGDNIEKARKETKGYLSFRKSDIVYIPNEVKEELLKNDIKIIKTDVNTGEVIDITEKCFSKETVRKINKIKLKEESEDSQLAAVFKDDKEVPIETITNINVKPKNIITGRRG